MKRIVMVIAFCLLIGTAGIANAELKHYTQDESYTIIKENRDFHNSFGSFFKDISPFNEVIFRKRYNNIIIIDISLPYQSNLSHTISNGDLELIIDNQKFYIPFYKTPNIWRNYYNGVYSIDGQNSEVINAILKAKNASMNFYKADGGFISWNVRDYILNEWKSVLTANLIPEFSNYQKIQWGNRNNDTFYCIDICDENWNPYDGFRGFVCGDNLHSWSPREFINNVLNSPDYELYGFAFNWRVWSPTGYGGEGFEGTVICP